MSIFFFVIFSFLFTVSNRSNYIQRAIGNKETVADTRGVKGRCPSLPLGCLLNVIFYYNIWLNKENLIFKNSPPPPWVIFGSTTAKRKQPLRIC